MRSLAALLRIVPVDLKNVRRDPMLVWTPVFPVIIALLLRWGAPALAGTLERQAGLDVTSWAPLLMSSFVVMMPGLVGLVVGFLLLDERDEGVFSAILVTPLPPWGYLVYRIALPLAVGLVMTVLMYPVAGLAPLPALDLLAAAALASLGAPFMALLLASFADNKVTGFTLMKLLNAVNLLPVVAYFVAEPLQYVAGIVPSYWPMKLVWRAAAGRPWGGLLAVGVVVNVAAVGMVLARFRRVVHR